MIIYADIQNNKFITSNLVRSKNPPLTVGYKDIVNFINVTNVNNEHACVVESKLCHHKKW